MREGAVRLGRNVFEVERGEQKNDILLVANKKDICNPCYHQQDEKVHQGARMTCLTR